MSYQIVNRRAPERRSGVGIDINGQGAVWDASRVWSFFLLPGMIGLLGLWVVAKVIVLFGSRS